MIGVRKSLKKVLRNLYKGLIQTHQITTTLKNELSILCTKAKLGFPSTSYYNLIYIYNTLLKYLLFTKFPLGILIFVA